MKTSLKVSLSPFQSGLKINLQMWLLVLIFNGLQSVSHIATVYNDVLIKSECVFVLP